MLLWIWNSKGILGPSGLNKLIIFLEEFGTNYSIKNNIQYKKYLI